MSLPGLGELLVIATIFIVPSLEVVFKIFAVRGLIAAPQVRWDNKTIWVAIIQIVWVFGPLAWFLFGETSPRRPEDAAV